MATKEVYYTIEAFAESLVVTASPESKSNAASLGDIEVKTNHVWNYFGTRGGFIPLTNGSVYNQQLVVYVIRVWEKGSDGSVSLSNSQGVKISFDNGSTLKTWATAQKDFCAISGIQTVHGQSNAWKLDREPATSSIIETGVRHAYFAGDAFYLFAQPIAGKTGSIGVPPVRVTLTANSYLNTSGTNYTVPESALKKAPAAVTFSAGKGNSTQMPKEVSALEAYSGGYAQFSPCDGLWYVLSVKEQVTISAAPAISNDAWLKNRYKVIVQAYDEQGNLKLSLNTYEANAKKIGGLDANGRANILPDEKSPGIIKGKQDIQTKAKCLDDPNRNNGNGNGNGDGGGTPIPYDPKEPKENPPNHFFTRDIPYMKKQMQRLGVTDGGSGLALEYAGKDLTGATNNLGYFYQDSQSAETQNNDGKLRFHFNYNPTSISYQTQSNTSIDWTLGNADTANVLGGNTAVSFTLYLNRIADMTEVRRAVTSGSTRNYPRPLTAKEIQGLLTRGTEYDLEFLYRIVNGNPEPADNFDPKYQNPEGLLAGTKGGISSDFGYITGIPFWIRFHDNLRYKVSLNSLQVDHVLFTEDMIPMLTTVAVAATRIPAFGKIDDAIEQKFKDSTATIRKTTTSGLATKP